MKATFSVAILKQKLAQVSALVRSNPASPINGYIKLTALGDYGELTGSDIAATLSTKFPVVEVVQPPHDGTILLPAKLLREVISALPAETVTIESVSETSIKITSGKYKAKLHTEAAVGFPVFPPEEFRNKTEVGLSLLLSLVEKASFGVPDNDSKYSVNTALLEATGKKINLAGTNGSQLVLASVDAEAVPFSLNLPKTALDLLSSLSGGDTVKIKESDGAFIFATDLDSLLVRKTAGQFPPAYAKIFPTSFKTQIKIKQEELLSAIERQLPLADEKQPRIVFHIATDGVELNLHADSAVAGESEDSVPATGRGPATEFTLNGAWVQQFVQHAEGEIEINSGSDEIGPQKTKVIDFQNGPNYRYVIVPLW